MDRFSVALVVVVKMRNFMSSMTQLIVFLRAFMPDRKKDRAFMREGKRSIMKFLSRDFVKSREISRYEKLYQKRHEFKKRPA